MGGPPQGSAGAGDVEGGGPLWAPKYLAHVASDVLKRLGFDLPLLLKAGALEGHMTHELLFFQKKPSN